MGDKVVKPYVTMKVEDERGQLMTLGFYEGAPVPDSVSDEERDRLRRKGMIAEEGTAAADAAVPHGVPVTFDDAGHTVPRETEKAAVQRADKSRQSSAKNG